MERKMIALGLKKYKLTEGDYEEGLGTRRERYNFLVENLDDYEPSDEELRRAVNVLQGTSSANTFWLAVLAVGALILYGIRR